MRFKLFVLAALVSVLTIGIYMPQVHAADGIVPIANVSVWSGYHAVSKERTEDGKDKTDLEIKFPKGPTPSEVGAIGNLGNLMIKATIGITDTLSNEGDEIVSVNEAFAQYNFGDFELLIGRTLTPWGFASINPFMDIANDNKGAFSATQFEAPTTQLKFMLKGFYLAAAKPATPMSLDASGSNLIGSEDYEQVIPKVGIGYVAPMPFQFSAHFVYQTTKMRDDAEDPSGTTLAEAGKTITSWSGSAGIHAFMPFGIIHAYGYYAQNARDMGMLSYSMMGPTAATHYMEGTSVKNTKSYGANAGFMYNILPNLSVGVGGSYDVTDNDVWKDSCTIITYFASLQYNVSKNFKIAPAVKYVDFGEAPEGSMGPAPKADRGTEMYYGILWIANM